MEALEVPILSISVVIPAYNAGCYLAATLQSIVSQGVEKVEVVLVDGGSTDDTLAVAASFSMLQMTILSESDKGQLDALHKGLRLAQNDIVLWLNADDIVMPGAFERARAAFVDPQVDYIYSDNVAFEEESQGYFYGAEIKNLYDLDHFFFYRQMYSECVYWRREVTRALPEQAYSLRVYTDYAFFLRLRWGRRGRWLPERLGAFRIRPGQASAEFAARKSNEYCAVKAMHCDHIGMSKLMFSLLRVAYLPWFATRHLLVPQVKRGVRRLHRYLTKDRERQRQARDFFENWLLPMGSKGPRHG